MVFSFLISWSQSIIETIHIRWLHGSQTSSYQNRSHWLHIKSNELTNRERLSDRIKSKQEKLPFQLCVCECERIRDRGIQFRINAKRTQTRMQLRTTQIYAGVVRAPYDYLCQIHTNNDHDIAIFVSLQPYEVTDSLLCYWCLFHSIFVFSFACLGFVGTLAAIISILKILCVFIFY